VGNHGEAPHDERQLIFVELPSDSVGRALLHKKEIGQLTNTLATRGWKKGRRNKALPFSLLNYFPTLSRL